MIDEASLHTPTFIRDTLAPIALDSLSHTIKFGDALLIVPQERYLNRIVTFWKKIRSIFISPDLEVQPQWQSDIIRAESTKQLLNNFPQADKVINLDDQAGVEYVRRFFKVEIVETETLPLTIQYSQLKADQLEKYIYYSHGQPIQYGGVEKRLSSEDWTISWLSFGNNTSPQSTLPITFWDDQAHLFRTFTVDNNGIKVISSIIRPKTKKEKLNSGVDKVEEHYPSDELWKKIKDTFPWMSVEDKGTNIFESLVLLIRKKAEESELTIIEHSRLRRLYPKKGLNQITHTITPAEVEYLAAREYARLVQMAALYFDKPLPALPESYQHRAIMVMEMWSSLDEKLKQYWQAIKDKEIILFGEYADLFSEKNREQVTVAADKSLNLGSFTAKYLRNSSDKFSEILFNFNHPISGLQALRREKSGQEIQHAILQIFAHERNHAVDANDELSRMYEEVLNEWYSNYFPSTLLNNNLFDSVYYFLPGTRQPGGVLQFQKLIDEAKTVLTNEVTKNQHPPFSIEDVERSAIASAKYKILEGEIRYGKHTILGFASLYYKITGRSFATAMGNCRDQDYENIRTGVTAIQDNDETYEAVDENSEGSIEVKHSDTSAFLNPTSILDDEKPLVKRLESAKFPNIENPVFLPEVILEMVQDSVLQKQ